MIKAIILDIDGTLTNSQKEITPDTKEALMKAQKAGIRLAIASARSQNGLARFGRWLDFEHNHGVLICYNGGLIVDAQTGETIYSKAMPKELAKEILEYLKQFDVMPMVDKGKYMYLNDVYHAPIHFNGNAFDVIKYETRSNEFLICEIRDLAEWVDFEVPKILVAMEPDLLNEIEDKLTDPFKDRAKVGRTAPFYFEYNALGVDKAIAMKDAFASLGIGYDEMMAFGDAQNDAGMIKAVKYGIAMGNAVPEAKEAADYITDDIGHDGVYKALEHFGLI